MGSGEAQGDESLSEHKGRGVERCQGCKGSRLQLFLCGAGAGPPQARRWPTASNGLEGNKSLTRQSHIHPASEMKCAIRPFELGLLTLTPQRLLQQSSI